VHRPADHREPPGRGRVLLDDAVGPRHPRERGPLALGHRPEGRPRTDRPTDRPAPGRQPGPCHDEETTMAEMLAYLEDRSSWEASRDFLTTRFAEIPGIAATSLPSEGSEMRDLGWTF